jgi:hypothetical protein
LTKKEELMAGNIDQMKGKGKEAVGDLTGTRISSQRVRPTGRPARSRRRSAMWRRKSKW